MLSSSPWRLGFVFFLVPRTVSLKPRPRGICRILWVMMCNVIVVELNLRWMLWSIQMHSGISLVSSVSLGVVFVRLGFFFVLKQTCSKSRVINVIYNLFLHVLWGASSIILWAPTCFLCYLWFSPITPWKRRSSRVLLCLKPSVIIPNRIHYTLSVCFPESNKNQTFLLKFQDRTCLITPSFLSMNLV